MNRPRAPWSPEEFDKLLADARDGSKNALGQLLQAYQDYLLAIARGTLPHYLQTKVAPSDAVQETLVSALKRMPQFQASSHEQFKGWLRKILENTMTDFQRSFASQKRNIAQEVSLDPHSAITEKFLAAAETTDPARLLERQELCAAVSACLSELPEEQSTVLRLRYRGIGNVEIAEQLGLSLSEVLRRVSRALDLLGHVMEAYGTIGSRQRA
jgi:RNA polymerase sigma-70 factor (ECF subfamily)